MRDLPEDNRFYMVLVRDLPEDNRFYMVLVSDTTIVPGRPGFYSWFWIQDIRSHRVWVYELEYPVWFSGDHINVAQGGIYLNGERLVSIKETETLR